jgi:S-adenosylmethionine hydrolase
VSLFLFTDFGAADIYVGQVKAVFARLAPGIGIIDLTHDAANFNVRAGAHLLAALATQSPSGSVTLAVVDPGVGVARDAVVVQAGGNWFVGPDNGLLSVVAARAAAYSAYRVTWRPERLSSSFHGRDLFAPVAAALACGESLKDKAIAVDRLQVEFGADDLREIIYIDHYGNALTGLRAHAVARDTCLAAGGISIGYARVYSDTPAGALFWYENSLGLVEIAANGSSAAAKLALSVGQPIAYCA